MVSGFRDGGAKIVMLLLFVVVAGVLAGVVCSLLWGPRKGLSAGAKLLFGGACLVFVGVIVIFPGAVARRNLVDLLVWGMVVSAAGIAGIALGFGAPPLVGILRRRATEPSQIRESLRRLIDRFS